MATWKGALVLAVASSVVTFPVVTQVGMARLLVLGVFSTREETEQALGISPLASQPFVVLPQGKELRDEELQKNYNRQTENLYGIITGQTSIPRKSQARRVKIKTCNASTLRIP